MRRLGMQANWPRRIEFVSVPTRYKVWALRALLLGMALGALLMYALLLTGALR